MEQAQMQATWPQAQAATAAALQDWGDTAALESAEAPATDFSRVGLILCFLSAVLTLAGIGSALERIFS